MDNLIKSDYDDIIRIINNPANIKFLDRSAPSYIDNDDYNYQIIISGLSDKIINFIDQIFDLNRDDIKNRIDDCLIFIHNQLINKYQDLKYHPYFYDHKLKSFDWMIDDDLHRLLFFIK